MGDVEENSPKKRIIAYIDGFNLYHAIHDLNKPELKWVNLWSLMDAFVQKSSEELVGVYYFTAHATWHSQRHRRHIQYINAQNANGVTTVLGQFKRKDRRCKNCGASWIAHEEKESDVNLAISLVIDAHKNNYDKALVVTSDSDLSPPIRTVCDNFPEKAVDIVVPPSRFGNVRELRAAASSARKIKQRTLSNNLLPEEVLDDSGNVISIRPASYAP